MFSYSPYHLCNQPRLMSNPADPLIGSRSNIKMHPFYGKIRAFGLLQWFLDMDGVNLPISIRIIDFQSFNLFNNTSLPLTAYRSDGNQPVRSDSNTIYSTFYETSGRWWHRTTCSTIPTKKCRRHSPPVWRQVVLAADYQCNRRDYSPAIVQAL